MTIPLLRAFPAGARSGQPLGLAKIQNVSPNANLRNLAVLALAGVAGAIVFARFRRTEKAGWVRHELIWLGCALAFLVALDGGTVAAVLLSAVPWAALGALTGSGRVASPRPIDCALAAAAALVTWVLLVRLLIGVLGSPAGLAIVLFGLVLLVLVPLGRWRTPTGARRFFVARMILPGAVLFFMAGTFLREPFAGDLFEDGHGLLPAAEYSRGERPYADIVPGHGLVTDGLLQLGSLRLFGDSYVGLRRGERAVGLLFWPLVYFMSLAATRRPSRAFASTLLLLLLFPQLFFLRLLFTLATLTVVFEALHRRRAVWWAVAGAMSVAGVLYAADFGLYTGAATLAAVVVSRGARRRNVAAFVVGALVTAVIALLLFALLRILGAFADTTFRLLPGLFGVYAAGMPAGPGFLPFGTRPGPPTRDDVLFYTLLLGAILVVATWAAKGRSFGRRAGSLVVVAVWCLTATLSVVSRSHSNYPLFLAPLGLVLVYAWQRPAVARLPRGIVFGAAVSILLAALQPFAVFRSFAARSSDVVIPATYRRMTAPDRVAGSFFREGDTTVMQLVARLQDSGLLTPNETWFDFANLPALYYVFGRDCPIRYYEVPFFQPIERQKEVIAALEANRNVRLAFVPVRDSGAYAVDGIPNARRAPLVYAYLERRFRPLASEGNLEVWARK